MRRTSKRTRRTTRRDPKKVNADRIGKLRDYAVAGAGAGAAIGSVIPGLGTAVGGVIGGVAGGMYGHFYGSGDYKLKSNSLIDIGDGSFRGVGSDYVRLRNSEYLGPVSMVNGTENLRSFRLNPANKTTFPWLSNIANCYEQWIPNGIVFEFRSTASQAITSGTSVGTVTFATEYDVYDNGHRNVGQMLESAYSQQNGVHVGQVHGIECDARHNPMGMFYILHDGQTPGGSLREYELGITTIAASGGSSSGDIGHLWVHYDITFGKVQSPEATGNVDRWYGSTAYSSAAPLPALSFRGVNTAGGTVGAVSVTGDKRGYLDNTSYYFPDSFKRFGAVYLIGIRWIGTSAACVIPNFTSTGCERMSTAAYEPAARLWTNQIGTGSDAQVPAGAIAVTSAQVTMWILVKITVSNVLLPCFFTLGTATLHGTPTSFDMTVIQVPALQLEA